MAIRFGALNIVSAFIGAIPLASVYLGGGSVWGGLPALLTGYAFLTDDDGAYLTDADGAYLIVEAA